MSQRDVTLRRIVTWEITIWVVICLVAFTCHSCTTAQRQTFKSHALETGIAAGGGDPHHHRRVRCGSVRGRA